MEAQTQPVTAKAPTRNTQEEITQAWREEINQRIAQLESGEVKALDGAQVLAELEAKYARRAR